jgi:hypothetical protein
MERNANTGLLVETNRHAQFRNALLTIAFGGLLLLAFLQLIDYYPVTVWAFASEPHPLGSGPITYYVLSGETMDGRFVEVPAIGVTNSLFDRNAGLARATEVDASFMIPSPHPRNAQLWARLRVLPPSAGMDALLMGWGSAYNMRRDDNSPDLLRAVRLDKYEWPCVHFSDFAQHKTSWRVQLSAP